MSTPMTPSSDTDFHNPILRGGYRKKSPEFSSIENSGRYYKYEKSNDNSNFNILLNITLQIRLHFRAIIRLA